MILKIKEWCGMPLNYHTCIDEEGKEHRVDLYVDGSLDNKLEPEALIDREVSVIKLCAYTEIAYNVELLPDE